MYDKLLVGLGNIGEQYIYTRHNIGFIIIDYFKKRYNINTIFEKRKLGYITKIYIKNKKILLLKPSTYMNNSGVAVKYWVEYKNINLSNLMVIVDDIYRDLGIIKIKPKGGHGGHNGLKSIQHHLNTIYYNRMYIGIGKNFIKNEQKNYVLGRWKDYESKIIENKIYHQAYKSLTAFILYGINYTMNNFNNL